MKLTKYKTSILLVVFLTSLCFAVADYNFPLADDYYTEALWNMDASDGGIVSDQCEQNLWRHHELQLFNGASLVTGKTGFGNALQFDGVDDYAGTTYMWPKHRTGIIIELWVWIDSANTGDDYIVSSGSWRLYTNTNGTRINFSVFDGKDNNVIITRSIIRGTWQHIKAEYNEGIVSLSLNGIVATNSTPCDKLYFDGGYIYLGDKAPNYGSAFKGKIDDLKITSPQVTSVAQRGKDMVECEFFDVDPYNHTLETDNPKYIVGWCAAALWLGEENINVTAADIATANSRLADLNNPVYFEQITHVQPENDSGDIGLYWALPTMVRIVNDPVILSRTNTAARASLQNVLTNFVAERDRISDAQMTQYDLWTMYKSMNHDWLIKATCLLTAQYYKNIGLNIYDDGFTAQQHYDAWVKHLTEKIKQLAARGIDPEIASPGYMSITLESMFNIRDLCEDKCLANEADKYITLYLADAAAESYHGVRGGGKTRVYKDSWGPNADNDFLDNWTHFVANDPVIIPGGALTNNALTTAMSGYRPPLVLQNLITDVQNKSFIHSSSRPGRGSYNVDHMNPVYHLIFPSDIRRYTYGNSKFIMGSFTIKDAQQEGAYYTFISEADQWMGVITSGWLYSRAYIQADTGSDSGYNELNAIQSGTAMLVKRQEYPQNDKPLYCWLSDDFRKNVVGPNSTTNNWIFAKNYTGDVYVAFKAIDPTYTVESMSTVVPGTQLKVTFTNKNTIVAFEAASASDYASFAAFQTAIKARTFRKNPSYEVEYITLDGTNLKMYTNGNPPKLNNVIYDLNIARTYEGQYLSNDYYDSPVIYITDPSGNKLTLDFRYGTDLYSADINNDCSVDFGDLAILVEQWLQ